MKVTGKILNSQVDSIKNASCLSGNDKTKNCDRIVHAFPATVIILTMTAASTAVWNKDRGKLQVRVIYFKCRGPDHWFVVCKLLETCHYSRKADSTALGESFRNNLSWSRLREMKLRWFKKWSNKLKVLLLKIRRRLFHWELEKAGYDYEITAFEK